MSEQDDLRKKLRENYSERAVDHMLRPKNMRRVTKPDGFELKAAPWKKLYRKV